VSRPLKDPVRLNFRSARDWTQHLREVRDNIQFLAGGSTAVEYEFNELRSTLFNAKFCSMLISTHLKQSEKNFTPFCIGSTSSGFPGCIYSGMIRCDRRNQAGGRLQLARIRLNRNRIRPDPVLIAERPPAQIPTYGFPAYGSNLGSKRQLLAACVLAPVSRFSVAASGTCLLVRIPLGPRPSLHRLRSGLFPSGLLRRRVRCLVRRLHS